MRIIALLLLACFPLMAQEAPQVTVVDKAFMAGYQVGMLQEKSSALVRQTFSVRKRKGIIDSSFDEGLMFMLGAKDILEGAKIAPVAGVIPKIFWPNTKIALKGIAEERMKNLEKDPIVLPGFDRGKLEKLIEFLSTE
jgi:hypothetical protein